MVSGAFTCLSPLCPQQTAHRNSTGAPHPSPSSLRERSLGGVLRWNFARAAAQGEESVYQSASKTIKRHSVGEVKTPKIRAELFFRWARETDAPRAPSTPIRFLNRRRPMRFWETIGQHFRRALVSRPIRSRNRGSSHEMGAGAIAERAIEIASTETSEDTLSLFRTSRRIWCIAGGAFEDLCRARRRGRGARPVLVRLGPSPRWVR
jgi:hypothetical protein